MLTEILNYVIEIYTRNLIKELEKYFKWKIKFQLCDEPGEEEARTYNLNFYNEDENLRFSLYINEISENEKSEWILDDLFRTIEHDDWNDFPEYYLSPLGKEKFEEYKSI